jgi:hypothetical protein
MHPSAVDKFERGARRRSIPNSNQGWAGAEGMGLTS